MLFPREKEDDDDFFPNPNYQSNLASIFGNSSTDGNPSLTYTAPKQPRPPKPLSKTTPGSSAMPSTTSSTSIIYAKCVQTFKMVDGAYQNQGRLGVALIQTVLEEASVFQLILYRDKRHQLSSMRVSRDFKFHIQPKNYCTFYDNQAIIWSILFESPLDVAEFSLQVAVAKWKAGDPTSPIIFQDLWCPVSETTATTGDTVEMTYSIHTIVNCFQDPEESQSVCVEVEATGWKQALVGVQPSTQKVVIMQPFMLGDLNPKEVVYNSPVVVKLSAVQVMKTSSDTVDQPKEEVKQVTKDSSKPQTSAVGESSANSPRSSPKATKADLITRMARMGQALPFKTAAAPSDSDEPEEDQSNRLQRSNRMVPKPRTRAQQSAAVQPTALPPAPHSSMVRATPPLTPPVAVTQHPVPVQWAASPYMGGSMYPVSQMQSPDSQAQFNMFVSEVRTTNSELRMGVTRLTDKVESLQSKLEDSGNRAGQQVTSVVERLLENEQHLRNQLELVLSALSSSQLSSQNRIPPTDQESPPHHCLPGQPAAPCQRCMDLERTNTSLSELMKKLEQENEFLQTSSSAQKEALQNAKFADKDQLTQIETLQKQLREEEARLSELNEQLQTCQKEKEMLTKDFVLTKTSVSDLQNTLQEKQTSIDKLEQALKESEATKLEEVRRNLQEVLDPKPVIGDHIKKILNAVYRLVKVQFEPQNKYEASFIQTVLAETIKAVTLEYLQNGDLANEKTWPRPASSLSSVGQTQSAPVVTSDSQVVSEELRSNVNGQYMRRDQRKVETATSELQFSTPLETSAASLHTDSTLVTAVVDISEKSVAENPPSKRLPDESNNNRLAPTLSLPVVESTDESSDDGHSISDKLQTVLLHLSSSQTKISGSVPISHWPPIPPLPSWYFHSD